MLDDKLRIELPDDLAEFIASHSTLTLATASAAGVPHVGTYLYVTNGPQLYIWMRPQTTVARDLEQNSAVAFTIRDEIADPRRGRRVEGEGDCALVFAGEEIARVARRFGDAFPEVSPGNTLSISFFRITATSLELVDEIVPEHLGLRGPV